MPTRITVPMQANDHAVSQYDVAGFQWCTHHTDPPILLADHHL